ncbi:OmpH family outer membrane protein [Marinobacteraceae bacterium S3BR75-40.1]
MRWLHALTVTVLMAVSMTAAAELKVGVVDLRQALFTSDAAKSFSQKLQENFKDDENKVRAAQDEAQKLKERLEKDGAMMNEAERKKLAQQFQEKAKEFSYLKNKLDSAVTSQKQDFLQQSRPMVDESLQELLDSRELDLILPREAVVYAKPSMDLTEELIKKLNAKSEQ